MLMTKAAINPQWISISLLLLYLFEWTAGKRFDVYAVILYHIISKQEKYAIKMVVFYRILKIGGVCRVCASH